MMTSHERSRCDGLTCGMRRKAYLARPPSFEDQVHAQFEALIHAMAEHIMDGRSVPAHPVGHRVLGRA